MRSDPIGFGYFLVYTFKTKKFESIASNGPRDIAKSLKISFGSSFVSLHAFGSKFWQFRFSVDTFQTGKPYSIIFNRSWVLVYITFAHGRTDRHFSEKFSFFFLIKNIYTCLYLSRLFLKFLLPVIKVSMLFSHIEIPKFTFQIRIIRKTSLIFVNWSEMNVSNF